MKRKGLLWATVFEVLVMILGGSILCQKKGGVASYIKARKQIIEGLGPYNLSEGYP